MGGFTGETTTSKRNGADDKMNLRERFNRITNEHKETSTRWVKSLDNGDENSDILRMELQHIEEQVEEIEEVLMLTYAEFLQQNNDPNSYKKQENLSIALTDWSDENDMKIQRVFDELEGK